MYTKYASQYIKRHPLLTLASIFSLTLSFFSALIFGFTTYGSHCIIKYFESKAQISAYFKDDVPQESILSFKQELEQSGLVSTVGYVSKAQAKDMFLAQNSANSQILGALDDKANPFPASLEIEAKQIEDLGTIASVLGDNEAIEDISYHKEVVDSMRKWTGGLRFGGLTVLAVFSIVSLLVVLVTISLTIFSKKDEIENMRLLGAHKKQIRGPFLLQGAFYGLMSAFISMTLLVICYYFLWPTLERFLHGVPFPQAKLYLWGVLAFAWLVWGSIVGASVSFLATGRYLKK